MVTKGILQQPVNGGVIVEAGSASGGSTCKLSIAANMAHRKLFAFDTFDGLPELDKALKRKYPNTKMYRKGMFKGSVAKVKSNLIKFGEAKACTLVKGEFKETLHSFSQPIAFAFIDVDYDSSARLCLKQFYPLLLPGGAIYSHDGHLPWVRDVIYSERFWEKEIGCKMPKISTVVPPKLLKISKIASEK